MQDTERRRSPHDYAARTEFFAKPEVKEVLVQLEEAARRALPAGSFADREEAMLALFDEAGRGLLEEDLQGLADSCADRVLVDGVEYKKHELGAVQYYSLGGTLRVRRDSYRLVGVHNGPTVVPLELMAEGATPALAYNVLHGYGQRDMRQHAESLAAQSRASTTSNARTDGEAPGQSDTRGRTACRGTLASGREGA